MVEGQEDEAPGTRRHLAGAGGRCALGRPVLISGAVAAETATPLVSLGEHVLRGITVPCAVFTLPDA